MDSLGTYQSLLFLSHDITVGDSSLLSILVEFDVKVFANM